MFHSNRITTLLCVLSCVTLFGCSSTPKQESTGEYFDDGMITTKVIAAILHEPGLKSSEINVETFKNRVQLSGFVSSQSEIDLATKVTNTVKGVRSIKNDIRLK
jgi:osmotically-inducible protein OsmY